MGGSGSGNHTRKRGDMVEMHRRLDVFQLRKAKVLRAGWSGNWSWTNPDGTKSPIGLSGGADQIRLDYRVRMGGGAWQDVVEHVAILYNDCHLGGQRAYFGCPGCGGRVRYLYGAGKRFLCRTCHDLVHASSREGKLDRTLRKVRKLRRRLGGDVSSDAPLQRPRYMRQQTYDRLVQEIIATETIVTGQFYERLQALRSESRASRSVAEGFWT